MKNYLPIAVGLMLLAASPALANDGMGVDVNAKAQTDLSAGAAAGQLGAPTQSTTDPKTADAKTTDSAQADATTQPDSNTTMQQTTQQTSETDSKSAPVLENQPAAGTVPGTEATQTETKTTETSSTEAKGSAAAPNVQKLFKFFHSQKQQAEGETGKKDASTSAPNTQSPQ